MSNLWHQIAANLRAFIKAPNIILAIFCRQVLMGGLEKGILQRIATRLDRICVADG